MLCAGFLLLVTAALVEHVRVCCRGSLGGARAASVTAARVSMCSANVVGALLVTAALIEHVRVCCRGSLGRARAASVTAARVSMCSADVVGALLVTAALVEHVRVCCRGSLSGARAASVTAARVSMCTRAVAALVERARVGPGCSMPVGPVVVARVGSCRRQVDVSGARRWAKRRHRQSPLLAEHVHVRRRGSG